MKKIKTVLVALSVIMTFATSNAQVTESYNTNSLIIPNTIANYGLVGADFNEDGKMDIVKVDNSDTIGIYLGNATGILDSIIKIHIPVITGTIICVDFNHDGHIDLIVANYSTSDSIGILYGNGHCEFSTVHYIYKNPINIDNIYASDFNNDGFPDLVLLSDNTTIIKILLNDTHGNFILSSDVITTIYYAQYMLTVDINNDNNNDLVIINWLIGKISIFLGNGDGTFGNAIITTLPVNSHINYAISTDYNNDGIIDLVIVIDGGINNITPLFGNGDGTFTIQQSFAIGKHPYMITGTDFNGDGKIDIISTNYNAHDISFFINNDNGTFVNDTNIYSNLPANIISADFNNDGKNDIAFVSDIAGPAITVLTNTSTLPTPKICIVTEDASHTRNVIAWEKTNMNLVPVDSFVVYRENGTNNYQRIGAVSKDSMSTFTDSSANPNTTSYRYKIRSKNTLDISYGSKYHNTILLINSGTSTFTWTPYSVENTITPVLSYNIFRDDSTTNNFQIVGSTAGTQLAYTDVDFSTYPNASYYVEAVLTSGDCHPTRSAFNGSTSNVKHFGTTGIQEINKLSINVYPNPATNVLNITGITHKTNVYLYDVVGNLVFEKETENNVVLNIEQFSKGIYIVKVGTSINKIIVQ